MGYAGVTNGSASNGSNAYAMIYCYPNSPEPEELDTVIKPYIWRFPTKYADCNPKWGHSHEFEFNWQDVRNFAARQSSAKDSSTARTSTSPDAEADVMVMLTEVTRELQDTRKEMKETIESLQSDVRTLSARVG